MFRLAAAILMILLMLAPAMVVAGPKGDVTITKIGDAVPNRIGSVERLVAPCFEFFLHGFTHAVYVVQ